MTTTRTAATKTAALPLLDICKWYSDPHGFVKELRHACHVVGFFTLKHDLPPNLAQQALNHTRSFFDLAKEEKLKISYNKSPAFRGYMPLGVENTGGKTDFREQVEIAKDCAATTNNALAWPNYYERLKGPNQWPENSQPNLKPCIMEYTQQLIRISEQLVQALGLALGFDSDALDHLFQKDPFWQLKLTSSRSTQPRDSKQDTCGVGAHTDTGFFTLLLQDQVGGLQVNVNGNDWIAVPPAGPDVLVCNLGEVAELVSGGYLLATPHRVVLSPSSSSDNKARISIPFFYNPTLSAVVTEPLHVHDDLWERSRDKKRWIQAGNVMHAHYGKNAFKSLARSHPRVFVEHHGDLKVLENGSVVKRQEDATT